MTELLAIRPQARPFSGGRPVTAYLKPSDYCNVGCEHCYLPEAVRASKYRMTDATLSRAIDTIEAMQTRQRAPGTLIVWHGGEPLALPHDYLRHACELVAQRLPTSIQSIQTSLVPYRDEWNDIIHDFFASEVGSSIDFTQRNIRGSTKRYQDFWMSRVEAARRNGISVIPGIVPSTSEIGHGAEIVTWMKDRQFNAWNIDRYNSFSGPDPMRPSNRDHSSFLWEVFEAILNEADKGSFTRVNTVTAALLGILNNQPGDRWGGACSMDFIVVNPDGSTNACPDKISFETFSNVASGFDGFLHSEQRRKWVRDHITGHRNSDCPTCPFNTFCKSGCPLTPNTPDSEGECSGYQRYLHKVRDFASRNPDLVTTYLYEVMK